MDASYPGFDLPPPNTNPYDPVDVTLFKDEFEDNFFEQLTPFKDNEDKLMLIHPSCYSKLNFFITFKRLSASKIKMTQLKETFCEADAKILIYVIPPVLSIAQRILNEMQHNFEQRKKKAGDKERDYHIFFIPKGTNECYDVFSSSIFSADTTFHNIGFDLFPLDYDLVSLEQPDAFKQLFINRNYDSLAKLSRALAQFELLFGKFKYRYVKGNCASVLDDLLKKDEIAFEINKNRPKEASAENDVLGCVFIDRDVDFITPFLSPATYAALLDNEYSIKNNTIVVANELIGKQVEEGKKNTAILDLSRGDRFYTMIKNLHFNKVKEILRTRPKMHEEITAKTKRSDDMKELQGLLKLSRICMSEKATLANHIHLATKIGNAQLTPHFKFKTMIEQQLMQGVFDEKSVHDFLLNELGKKADMFEILRFMCLQSLMMNGIKSKEYLFLKQNFLRVYGYQHIILFKNLERLSILKKPGNDKAFKTISNELKLLNYEINLMNPNDIGYVFNAFRPISISLIELLLAKGWSKAKDFLDKLPGESKVPIQEKAFLQPPPGKPNVVVLVFIGGITHSELAALRLLKKMYPLHNLIVYTTCIINHKTFLANIGYTVKEENKDKSYLMCDVFRAEDKK